MSKEHLMQLWALQQTRRPFCIKCWMLNWNPGNGSLQTASCNHMLCTISPIQPWNLANVFLTATMLQLQFFCSHSDGYTSMIPNLSPNLKACAGDKNDTMQVYMYTQYIVYTSISSIRNKHVARKSLIIGSHICKMYSKKNLLWYELQKCVNLRTDMQSIYQAWTFSSHS